MCDNILIIRMEQQNGKNSTIIQWKLARELISYFVYFVWKWMSKKKNCLIFEYNISQSFTITVEIRCEIVIFLIVKSFLISLYNGLSICMCGFFHIPFFFFRSPFAFIYIYSQLLQTDTRILKHNCEISESIIGVVVFNFFFY